MPAPFDVVPGNLPGTTPAESLDRLGNVTAAGNVSCAILLLGRVAAAPTPLPGILQLYTTDGVTLGMVAAGGVTPGQTIGNLTVNGTSTLNGYTQVNADLGVVANDAAGIVRLLNSSAVTGAGNADLLITEASAVSTALGVKVGADGNLRWAVDSNGVTSWGPGSGVADTVLGRSAAGVLSVTTGSLSVTTAGQGLRVKEGSNAKQGTATLAAGSAVVANTSVTATSRILLTSQVDGGTPGWLRVSARTAGTSFTITSSSGTDTSTVAYQIFEQG